MRGNTVQPRIDGDDRTPEQVLHQTLTGMAGPEAIPRPGQLEALTALVEQRRRVLVVEATGWGKSMVYWAATIAMRERGAGPTVVISPLLALMRDQIKAAAAVGLRAATVNSANLDDWNEVFASLQDNQVDVLAGVPGTVGEPQVRRDRPPPAR